MNWENWYFQSTAPGGRGVSPNPNCYESSIRLFFIFAVWGGTGGKFVPRTGQAIRLRFGEHPNVSVHHLNLIFNFVCATIVEVPGRDFHGDNSRRDKVPQAQLGLEYLRRSFMALPLAFLASAIVQPQ